MYTAFLISQLIVISFLPQNLDSNYFFIEKKPVYEKLQKRSVFNNNLNFYLLNIIEINDTIIVPVKRYIITGSFLIPNNADKQVSKLRKLGFDNAYKFNFPDSEYYSVVVDTFLISLDSTLIDERLSNHKIDFFVKIAN